MKWSKLKPDVLINKWSIFLPLRREDTSSFRKERDIRRRNREASFPQVAAQKQSHTNLIDQSSLVHHFAHRNIREPDFRLVYGRLLLDPRLIYLRLLLDFQLVYRRSNLASSIVKRQWHVPRAALGIVWHCLIHFRQTTAEPFVVQVEVDRPCVRMTSANHQLLPVVAVDRKRMLIECIPWLGGERKIPPNLIDQRPEHAIRRRQQSQLSTRNHREQHRLNDVQAPENIRHVMQW